MSNMTAKKLEDMLLEYHQTRNMAVASRISRELQPMHIEPFQISSNATVAALAYIQKEARRIAKERGWKDE